MKEIIRVVILTTQKALHMTKQISVNPSGVSFMITRLGADCSHNQFIRELTQNAIEAHTRHKLAGTGHIFWGRDPFYWETKKLSKLFIGDTGVGMDDKELQSFINSLACSGGEQGLTANFGMGAKIATAIVNPVGMIYMSWKHGKGHMIHFHYDNKTGIYGLMEINEKHAHNPYVRELTDDRLKPDFIKDHGTKVVLLGHNYNDDTYQPATESNLNWIPKYLNSKYYRLPPQVEIKFIDAESEKNNRVIRGQETFLMEKAISSGQVILKDHNAIAHWHILPKNLRDTRNYLDKGHTGAIYQDELYDVRTGNSAKALLARFGVVYGGQRVVIYVEPKNPNVTPNTARSALLLNKESLPWDEWAHAFREELPDEIKKLVDEERGETSMVDQKDIEALLSAVKGFFDLTAFAYKKAKKGLFKGHPDTEGDQSPDVTEGDGDTRTEFPDGPPSGIKKPRKPRTKNAYVDFLSGDEENDLPHDRTEVQPKIPQVEWTMNPESVANLEGYGAVYDTDSNTIIANYKFVGFMDFRAKLLETFQHIPDIDDTLDKSIKKWYGLALTEAVLGVLGVAETCKWDRSQIELSLSRDALTTICMQRYFQHMYVKREIGTRYRIKEA